MSSPVPDPNPTASSPSEPTLSATEADKDAHKATLQCAESSLAAAERTFNAAGDAGHVADRAYVALRDQLLARPDIANPVKEDLVKTRQDSEDSYQKVKEAREYRDRVKKEYEEKYGATEIEEREKGSGK